LVNSNWCYIYMMLFWVSLQLHSWDVIIIEDIGEDSAVEEAAIMASHPWLCVYQYGSNHWLFAINGFTIVADIKVILPARGCLP